MKKIIFITILSFSQFGTTSDFSVFEQSASKFSKATMLNPKVILDIAEVAGQTYAPENQDNMFDGMPLKTDIMVLGKKVGIIEEYENRIIIGFKGIDSLFCKNVLNYFLAYNYLINNNQGHIHKGIFSSFSSISKSESYYENVLNIEKNNRRDKEYIFTGYGFGGALALIAAIHFESRIEKMDNENLENENRIKIVTFSSPKIIRKNLKDFMYERIGKENILNFEHYFDYSPTIPYYYTNVGIPIRILPTESFSDLYYNYAHWKKASYGVLLAIAGSIIGSERYSIDHSKKEAFIKKLFGWTIVSLTVLDTFVGGTPIIPSPQNLSTSFIQTQENVKDFYDAHPLYKGEIPDQVGWVSLFSFQRGFGGWLHKKLFVRT